MMKTQQTLGKEDMNKPIYIKIREGKVYRTIARGDYYEDVDLAGNTVGLEVLSYKTFELNGKRVRKETKI